VGNFLGKFSQRFYTYSVKRSRGLKSPTLWCRSAVGPSPRSAAWRNVRCETCAFPALFYFRFEIRSQILNRL